jgi:hypothetical protein
MQIEDEVEFLFDMECGGMDCTDLTQHMVLMRTR